MDKNKRYHSFVISFLITVLTITIFISVQPAEKIFASGIKIYSPFWMNYEKDLESPYSYFKYCGIFDSCLNNEIRIFPFIPLTTDPQSDAQSDESDNINTRNTVSSMIPPSKTVSSVIPFQLPFP